MPVEKLDGAVLRKTDMGFDIISREAIDGLISSDAIALFTIMATRPPNWLFRRDWLMTRLGWGRHRYDNAMKELANAGHVTTATVREKDGTVRGRVMWFSQASPKVGSADLRNQPTVGSSDHLKNKETSENKEEEKKNREDPPRKRLCRQNEPPTLQEVIDYCREKNLNVDAAKFHRYYDRAGWVDSNGKRVKSWKHKCLGWDRQDEKPKQDIYAGAF